MFPTPLLLFKFFKIILQLWFTYLIAFTVVRFVVCCALEILEKMENYNSFGSANITNNMNLLDSTYGMNDILNFDWNSLLANRVPGIEVNNGRNLAPLYSLSGNGFVNLPQTSPAIGEVVYVPVITLQPIYPRHSYNIGQGRLPRAPNTTFASAGNIPFYDLYNDYVYLLDSTSPQQTTTEVPAFAFSNDVASNFPDVEQSNTDCVVPENLQRHFYAQDAASGYQNLVNAEIPLPTFAPDRFLVQQETTDLYATDMPNMYSGGVPSQEYTALYNTSTTLSDGSSHDVFVPSMANVTSARHIPPSIETDTASSSFYSSSNLASNTTSSSENNSFEKMLHESVHMLQSDSINETVPDTSTVSFQALGRNLNLDDCTPILMNMYKDALKHIYSISNDQQGVVTPQTQAVVEDVHMTEEFQYPTPRPISPGNNPLNEKLLCTFCLKNGEPEFVFGSHRVKDDNGIVTCPILRKYVCPTCGINGNYAHTVKYCPLNNFNDDLQGSFSASPQPLDMSLPSRNDLYNVNSAPQELTSFTVTPQSLDLLKPKNYISPIHSTPKTESSVFHRFYDSENTARLPFTNNDTENISNVCEQISPIYFDAINAEAIQTQQPSTSEGIFGEPNPMDYVACLENNNQETTFQLPSLSTTGKNRRICKFCRKNNQTPDVYRSHRLRNEDGIIACPFLRLYICDICGASGDNAHTRKYCPYNTYEDFIQTLGKQ